MRSGNWRRSGPPYGLQVRRLIAVQMMLYGAARALLTDRLAPGCCTLAIPNTWYGLALGLCGLGLWVTRRRRRTWYGRGAAVIASGVFGVLAVDAWPIAHSTVLMGIIALSLVMEAGFLHDASC